MKNVNEIMQAAKQICEEKNISLESVIETIEAALAVAYRKDFGEKDQNIKVDFDLETGDTKVFDEKTVVTDEKAELTEKLKAEKEAAEAAAEEQSEAEPTPAAADKKTQIPPETAEEKKEEEEEEEAFERFNPRTEITLSGAKKIKKSAKVGDIIRTKLDPPAAYGRMAAQTAKQVIIQRLREAERDMIFNEFKDKEGEVINGTVQRIEGRMVLIDLGAATALLPPSEQVPRERYSPGQRLKFYVVSVSMTPKGPEIILSRSHPEMVRKLFILEVPEIGNGSVEIKSIAREAGSRTKAAVYTSQKNIDPVGSCVGQRGARVQTIISEIGGEKIDIIEWDEDPVKFITNALSPAKVLSATINDEEKTALAEVKEDQLSLAIGKAGQNVRLSAKLTGWKIDIISDKGEKVTSADEHGKQPPAGRPIAGTAEEQTAAATSEEPEVTSDESVPVAEEKKQTTPESATQSPAPEETQPADTADKEEKEDATAVADVKKDQEAST